jgi:uncharacterized membrane protein
MTWTVAYIAAALVFAAIDAAWLTFAGPRLYKPILGPILADKVSLAPAIVFYLMYVAGVVFLAVAPALKDGQLRTAALNGFVLGLIAYGTYDLTNQATLRVWATKLTVVDMAYGSILTACAAAASYLAVTRLVKA